MSAFLIDTNVLSEFSRRDGPDPRLAGWLRETPRDAQYVSVITLAEIDRGIQLLEKGRRRKTLEAWLAEDIEVWFLGRILPVTRRLAARWAEQDRSHAGDARFLDRRHGA